MNPFRNPILVAATAASAALLTACAGGAPYGTAAAGLPGIMGLPGVIAPAPVTSGYGTVTGVHHVAAANQAGLGNIAGTVLGNGLPTSQGGDLASVATAVAVAMMTNQAGAANTPGGVYRVTVRMDNGEVRTFDYGQLPSLRTNDRVRVEGNQLYR